MGIISRKIALAAFLVPFLIALLFGAGPVKYYVHPGLSTGANDGSSWANAWRSFSAVNWTALGTAAQNDPVWLCVKKGINIVGSGAQLTIGADGSSDINRIFVGGIDPLDTGAKPILDGNNQYPGPLPCESGCYNSLVSMTARHYVTVDNLVVRNAEGSGIKADRNTSTFEEPTYINVTNCETYNTYRFGIILNFSTYGKLEDNIVDHAAMILPEYNQPNGIGGWPGVLCAVKSKNIEIRRNLVKNSYGEGIGLFSNSTDVTKQTQNCTIEDNVVFDARAAGVYIAGSAYNTVRRNLILGTYNSPYLRSGSFVGPGILIAEEFSTGANDSHDNDVYNNLIAGTYSCLDFGGSPTYGSMNANRFFNNTCVSNYHNLGAWTSNQSQQNNEVFNNIFLCAPGDVCSQITSAVQRDWFSVFDYNYHNAAPSNAAFIGANSIVDAAWPIVKTSSWQSFGEQDIDSLAEGFKQIASALTLDEGYGCGLYCLTDYWENSVYNSHRDIGAHELVEASTTVLSNGLPSGTQTCAATVTLQVTSDKAATLKFDTSDVAYASMANTFSTTGGTSHSHTFNVTCGQSYTLYVRAADSTSSLILSFGLDPGATNLLTASTYIPGSDTNTYDACYAREHLWDGGVELGSCNSTAGLGLTTIDIEFDLGQLMAITNASLFGDAYQDWGCSTWTFKHKALSGDSWTTEFADQACNGNQWYPNTISDNARYVRFEVAAPAETWNGIQVREMRVYGVPAVTPPSSTSLRPRAGRPAGANVPRAAKR